MMIDSKKYSGACACGHDHSMDTNLAVIQAGCLNQLDDYLQQFALQGPRAAIYDENTYHAQGLVRPRAEQEIILAPENLHANEIAVEKVLSQLRGDIAILIAVGSGTIHDITRYCAHDRGILFISCPTAATVDGFCSTVSAMTWYGFKKTLPGVAPALVLADLNVICKAPAYLALSGVGDILGKYTALADWKISSAVSGEFFCPQIESMTRKAVQAVYQSARRLADRNEEAYEELTYGLLLSGLAMQLMGNSRPASGAEHHISHLIEMEPDGLGVHSNALHGEKVGAATLLVAREYHHLAETEDIAPHVHTYRFPDRDYLFPIFGERLTDAVSEENRDSCMKPVTPTALIEHWTEIRSIIAEIPAADELQSLYRDVGMKSTLADLGVPQSALPKLMEYSPCVRNRMTLMRIRRMIDLPYCE
ncbi:sn-glycerol-1-phosphate dehydrogenase [Faecalispora jeddahensis]|uniref:sn-glycerol-1-phosphate dehydrogenase n=1 Tax=Faecalispora jeddahensis TaxID=1414721 RepID=UPI0027BA3118|nr:sn-glycerol-1-phosphate dehydrogenase [Faecalispora jeddahensis]